VTTTSIETIGSRGIGRRINGGRIVAITSYGSVRAFPGHRAIGAAKAAIESTVAKIPLGRVATPHNTRKEEAPHHDAR
jgi:enoyl-[acyl-carrier-protein] reductase (NADH)